MSSIVSVSISENMVVKFASLCKKKMGEEVSEELKIRFKGKTWAEVQWELEDEESAEMERVTRMLDTLRKTKYLKGEYELEEGEIIE